MAGRRGRGRAGGPALPPGQPGVATRALAGTTISAGLAAIRLNVPIPAGGALFVALALTLALLMPERGFRPTPQPERNSFQKIGHTFLDGARVVRHSPVLLTILAVIAVRGGASEAFDRLWQAHLVADIPFPAPDSRRTERQEPG